MWRLINTKNMRGSFRPSSETPLRVCIHNTKKKEKDVENAIAMRREGGGTIMPQKSHVLVPFSVSSVVRFNGEFSRSLSSSFLGSAGQLFLRINGRWRENNFKIYECTRGGIHGCCAQPLTREDVASRRVCHSTTAYRVAKNCRILLAYLPTSN